MIFCQQVLMFSSFFQFVDHLEQSRTRILDAWSMILTFEVIAPFFLTNCENRTKRYCYLIDSLAITLGKGTFLSKNEYSYKSMLKSAKN